MPIPLLGDETPKEAFDRAMRDPYSPGGMYHSSNMVLREDHYFNAANKRRGFKLSGIAGKLYNKFSVIQLIIDSHAQLQAERGWTTTKRIVDPEEERAARAKAQAPAIAYGAHCDSLAQGPPQRADARCTSCKSTRFEMMASNEGMACAECGMVQPGMRNMVSLHREKACAEEEDKTTRADRPREARDRFTEPQTGAADARRRREG